MKGFIDRLAGRRKEFTAQELCLESIREYCERLGCPLNGFSDEQVADAIAALGLSMDSIVCGLMPVDPQAPVQSLAERPAPDLSLLPDPPSAPEPPAPARVPPLLLRLVPKNSEK